MKTNASGPFASHLHESVSMFSWWVDSTLLVRGLLHWDERWERGKATGLAGALFSMPHLPLSSAPRSLRSLSLSLSSFACLISISLESWGEVKWSQLEPASACRCLRQLTQYHTVKWSISLHLNFLHLLPLLTFTCCILHSSKPICPITMKCMLRRVIKNSRQMNYFIPMRPRALDAHLIATYWRQGRTNRSSLRPTQGDIF